MVGDHLGILSTALLVVLRQNAAPSTITSTNQSLCHTYPETFLVILETSPAYRKVTRQCKSKLQLSYQEFTEWVNIDAHQWSKHYLQYSWSNIPLISNHTWNPWQYYSSCHASPFHRCLEYLTLTMLFQWVPTNNDMIYPVSSHCVWIIRGPGAHPPKCYFQAVRTYMGILSQSQRHLSISPIMYFSCTAAPGLCKWVVYTVHHSLMPRDDGKATLWTTPCCFHGHGPGKQQFIRENYSIVRHTKEFILLVCLLLLL